MKGKSLKKFVVIITAVFYLAITSVVAFAQSAIRGNDFSILGNVPEEQVFQLSDTEMVEVKGEGRGSDFVTIYAYIYTFLVPWSRSDAIAAVDTLRAALLDKRFYQSLTWRDYYNALSQNNSAGFDSTQLKIISYGATFVSASIDAMEKTAGIVDTGNVPVDRKNLKAAGIRAPASLLLKGGGCCFWQGWE